MNYDQGLGPVELSSDTEEFLERLDRLSNHSLVHRNELGDILELVRQHDLQARLDELAFGAKFCWNIYSTMTRIGTGAEGCGRLMTLFSENVINSIMLLAMIVEHSPEDVRKHFEQIFFPDTRESLQARIELLHDISWIKNWSIDHRSEAQG